MLAALPHNLSTEIPAAAKQRAGTQTKHLLGPGPPCGVRGFLFRGEFLPPCRPAFVRLDLSAASPRCVSPGIISDSLKTQTSGVGSHEHVMGRRPKTGSVRFPCHPVRGAARSGALQTRDLMAGNCMFRVPDQQCTIIMLHRIRDDMRSCFAHSCAGRDLV